MLEVACGIHQTMVSLTAIARCANIWTHLVQHQDPGFPQERSGETDELSLTRRKVASAFRHLRIQTAELILDKVFQVALLQGVPDIGIAVIADRVDVPTHGPLEELGILRNDRDCVTKILQSDRGDVDPVNEDLSSRRLDDPEQGQRRATLPGARTPADLSMSRHVSSIKLSVVLRKSLTPTVSPPLMCRLMSRRDGFNSGRYLVL